MNAISNCEKAEIIDALKKKHRLKDLFELLNISKSSYYYQASCLRRQDKYAQLRTEIRTLFYAVDGRYGYRLIHATLKSTGIVVSEKVVRCLMRENGLRVRCVKQKKYILTLAKSAQPFPIL